MFWRRKLSAQQPGGFDAAGSSRRLKHFQASRLHVNALVQSAGATVNARARWLIRNNGYAATAVDSWAANVVGAGIKPTLQLDDPALAEAIKRAWWIWTDEADADGITDWYGMQRRAAREMFIAGEVFFRRRVRRPEDGLTVPLQWQMLPSEMLPMTTQALPGGRQLRCGIEFDAIGRRVAYHFLRRHPGDITDRRPAEETVRVPADEVIHLIDPVEAGQIRGVSRLAPAIVKLFMLDQYDDAELDRKKVAAMYALFITTPQPADPMDRAETQSDDGRHLDLQPGMISMLEPGEDVKVSDPAESGQSYEAFQYRTLCQIAAACGLPYYHVANDTSKANYSSLRAGVVEFRRRVEAFQHGVLVWQMCRPMWSAWLDMAVLSGALRIPDYAARRRDLVAPAWLPPRWEWVDPLKDAKAEIEQIAAGLKSRTQALAERGYDVEQVDAEIAADLARQARYGIAFGAVGATTSPDVPAEDGEERDFG